MKKAKVIEAPNPLDFDGTSIFLAGSIEMGAAEDWQTKLIGELKNLDCTILNPRRKDWDSSWKQSIKDPQFYQQVNWELDALGQANIIAMYFSPGTQSPISLLELGLFAESDKLIICCPEGFGRKGNVDIVAERCSVPVYTNFDSFTKEIKKKIKQYEI
jgi:hypothetical protein